MQQSIYQKFVSATKLFFLHNQICCLIVFDATKTGFKPSKLKFGFNLILTMANCFLGLYCVYIASTKDIKRVVKITMLMVMVCELVYVSIVWVWSFKQRNQYIKLLTGIIEFDGELQAKNTVIDYGRLHTKITRSFSVHYSLFLAWSITSVIYWIWFQNHKSFEDALQYMNGFLLGFTNAAVCFETTQLAYMIHTRFVVLNRQITAIVQSFNKEINVIDLDSSRRKFLLLCKICRLHFALSGLVRRFNKIFGLMLLALFAICFLLTVLALFNIAIQLQSTTINWVNVLYLFIHSSLCVIIVLHVCNVCYNTIEQGKKAGELIHRIETEDPNIIDEIEMFSLQIANEQIEFSASDFFPIDHTLIFSIVGGVTTYIIILIQLSATLAE